MNEKYLKNDSKLPLVYWLNTEDIHNVVFEKLQRKLSHEEIEKLIKPIAEQINWSEAISLAIDLRI